MFHYIIELTFKNGIKNTFTAEHIIMQDQQWMIVDYYNGSHTIIDSEQIEKVETIKIQVVVTKRGE